MAYQYLPDKIKECLGVMIGKAKADGVLSLKFLFDEQEASLALYPYYSTVADKVENLLENPVHALKAYGFIHVVTDQKDSEGGEDPVPGLLVILDSGFEAAWAGGWKAVPVGDA